MFLSVFTSMHLLVLHSEGTFNPFFSRKNTQESREEFYADRSEMTSFSILFPISPET